MKLRNKILTIIVLGLISVSLSSQSTTFNGGGDGTSWNDAGNWSNGVPTATTSGYINGTSAVTITINNAEAERVF